MAETVNNNLTCDECGKHPTYTQMGRGAREGGKCMRTARTSETDRCSGKLRVTESKETAGHSAGTKARRGFIRCEKCGAEQRLDRKDARQNGWPKCCGLYMKPSTKPAARYEVTLQQVQRRGDEKWPRWCVTVYQGRNSAVSLGTLDPHPSTEADDEAITRHHTLRSLAVPVYIERRAAALTE